MHLGFIRVSLVVYCVLEWGEQSLVINNWLPFLFEIKRLCCSQTGWLNINNKLILLLLVDNLIYSLVNYIYLRIINWITLLEIVDNEYVSILLTFFIIIYLFKISAGL